MSVPHHRELRGLRILVVEGTLLIVDLISEAFEEAVCTIIGPTLRVDRELSLAKTELLRGALLAINLAGEPCFPIADAPVARGVAIAPAGKIPRDAAPIKALSG